LTENRVDKALQDFFVIPFIALIGIYAVASVLGSMLGVNNGFVDWFFAAVGVVGYFVNYFKKKLSEL
jgi:hypothetical protein